MHFQSSYLVNYYDYSVTKFIKAYVHLSVWDICPGVHDSVVQRDRAMPFLSCAQVSPV